MNSTKKSRQLFRKFATLKYFLILVLTIIIISVVLNYFVGTLKASTLDLKKGNVPYNFEEFKSYEEKKFELGTKYDLWIAQNDKYVVYMDEKTTILTIYVIEPAALTGAKVKQRDNIEYPVVDVTKCTTKYTTARNESGKNSNIVVEFANSKTGKKVNQSLNSMDFSVQFMNTLTDKFERHYYTKEVKDGIQIVYSIGKFGAGIDYLPEQLYSAMYKPYKGDYELGGEHYDKNKDEAFNEQKYNKALDKWAIYMAQLGVANAKEASREEINYGLSKTLEGRFRGNVGFNFKRLKEDKTAGTYTWKYTGTAKFFTREGFEYAKDLIEKGEIEGIPNEKTLHENNGNHNAYWEIKNISDEFINDTEKWFNKEDSPLTKNPFMHPYAYKKIMGVGYNAVDETDDRVGATFMRKSITGSTLQALYSYLYDSKELRDMSNTDLAYVNEKTGEKFINGGFPKINEKGEYLRDESGKLIREVYSTDVIASDNVLFNIDADLTLPVFNVGLQFKLTKDGLQTTIIADSLVDSDNASTFKYKFKSNGQTISELNEEFVLANITVLPFMNYVKHKDVYTDTAGNDIDVDETGSIIIPDGSGAVINFNNGKDQMAAAGVNKRFYGVSRTNISEAAREKQEDLMLGMYGFICTTPQNKRGILSVLEKGGNSVSLSAHTNKEKSQAYFQAAVREDKEIRIGGYSSKTIFTKWATNLAVTDFAFQYIFLEDDELNYSSLAKKYAKYLIERDNIEVKDNTQDPVVDINFVGAFEKYSLLFGFKKKEADSLTTFDQATTIVEELTTGYYAGTKQYNVKKMNVSYTSWTSEELEYSVGDGLSVSSVIGGRRGMNNFVNVLTKKGIDFYPETYITTTKNYDFAHGDLKYTARDTANTYAIQYPFNIATHREDKTLSPVSYISPKFYGDIATYIDNKTKRIENKLDHGKDNFGYYLVDLGNISIPDYKRGANVYGQATVEYQKEALNILSKDNKIKIKAPYDYAFKYVDFATSVPVTSTLIPIIDYAIPLYQLVANGIFDYTTIEINGTTSKEANWFLSKSLESGSNLSFILSYENPNILLDTDYTYFYQIYYKNWRSIILDMNQSLIDSGVYKGELTKHEIVAKDVALVEYTMKDGTKKSLYVNNTSSDVEVDGKTIPSYGFAKKVGG